MGEMCFGNNAFTKHLQWTCAALPPLSIIYSEGYTVTWLMPCLKYNQRCHRLILFSLTYKLFINWIIWLHLQQIRLVLWSYLVIHWVVNGTSEFMSSILRKNYMLQEARLDTKKSFYQQTRFVQMTCSIICII